MTNAFEASRSSFKLTQWLVVGSLILFPLFVVTADLVPGLAYVLLFFLGVFYFFYAYYRGRLAFKGAEKVFFLALCGLYPAALLTVLIAEVDLARGDRFLVFISAIPVYLACREIKVGHFWIWGGLIAGALLSAAVAFYQVLGPERLPRAVGVVHPIIFGNLALTMGVLPLVAFLLRDGSVGKILKYLVLAGFICGLAASALSKARGGWVALLPVLLLYFWVFSRYLPVRKILLAFAALIVALFMAYQSPSTGLQPRVELTVDNIARYFESDSVKDSARATSIGSRFEMWKSAWKMFQDNPLFGGGWGEFRKHTQALIAQGEISPAVGRYYHAHNQYLSTLAKGGMVSFLALMALLLVPGWLFLRTVLRDADDQRKSFALAGFALILLYMGFAMSEAIFERSRPILFFSFYLAVFMAQVLRPDATESKPVDQGSQ